MRGTLYIMTLAFTKYSANGNHFVLFDHMQKAESINATQVVTWCDPIFGIGADGVAQITPHADYQFQFRLWNSDGGEAEMCGNAARAAAWHFLRSHPTLKTVSFKTMNGVYQASLEDSRLWIKMTEHRQDLAPAADSFPEYARWYYINTGVPHLVLEVEDLASVDFKHEAPRLRRHRAFPYGTNVDFIHVADPAHPVVQLRVFERGVEGETWSCGTGVSAVAWACRQWYGWKEDMIVTTKGGEHRVRFVGEDLWYSGEIKHIFSGTLL